MASKTERTRLTPKLISLAVASCFATGAALANPTGPAVVNGQVTINQAGNLLSITNSPNAIINWNGFSISAGEITRFIQQNASSAVLNRVVGGVRSDILGALQSRLLDGTTTGGRVFLINPSGIVFGAGSQIDVGGLVASTLALSNEDFLGGRLRFIAEPGAGSVINNGAINAATGGQVYLVGTSVTNNGIITSPKGEVILAAGNSVELVNPGTPNLRVEITAPDNEARNLGSIVAEAGRVGIYAGLISHSGTIRADSAAAMEDGRIVLRATKNTTIAAGSVISASGPSGGQITIQSGDTTLVSGSVSATGSSGKGGTVQVLGNLVGLDDAARIDVSGEAGGGTALVGGDFQGKNPNVQNAYRTYFGPNATIDADAIGSGDGGTVIVWSDNATGAYGTISARGGSESGNGGFVETSSKGWLDFHANVNTSAPKGRTGTLLLDPADVCIYNASTANCPGTSGGAGSFSSGTSSIFFSSSTSSNRSDIQSGTLASELSDNNVTITTSNMSGGMGSITVADNLPDFATNNMLQLVAHDDVNVLGRIWNTGQGELRIYAGWDEAAMSVSTIQNSPFTPIPVIPNRGDINVNAGIDMSGNVLLKAGHDINVASGKQVVITVPCCSDTRSLSLTVDAGNAVTMTNALLKVDLSGGEGGNAAIKVLAGGGGVTVNGSNGYSMYARGGDSFSTSIAGGTGTIQVGTQDQPVTGPINLTNASISAEGGYGSNTNGGDAKVEFVGGSIMVNSSDITTYAGGAGNGSGVGGSGLIQMASAGNIDIVNSYVRSNGNNGDAGSGSGQTTASAAGNINVQNSFVGAEGHSGSFARVLMGANGSISIGDFSLIDARSSSGTSQGDGTAAQVTLIGNSIQVGDQSVIRATGGAGTANGGAASVNLIAAPGMNQVGAANSSSFDPSSITPAGPITISGAEGIGATGGNGPTNGGKAAITILGGGPVTLTDNPLNLSFPTTGIVAQGGQGTGTAGTGGGATTTVVSASSVTSTRSHVEATGGMGAAQGGSAFLSITASTDRAEQNPDSTSTRTTLIARGGDSGASGTPGSGNALFIVRSPTGSVDIINERVEVSGGRKGSGTSAPFGPGTITLNFNERTSGGFSVNGVEGAITGSPVGFFVNGQPAVLGSNFLLVYKTVLAPPPPGLEPSIAVTTLPPFLEQAISSLNAVADALTPHNETAAPTKEEKDQKKKQREC